MLGRLIFFVAHTKAMFGLGIKGVGPRVRISNSLSSGWWEHNRRSSSHDCAVVGRVVLLGSVNVVVAEPAVWPVLPVLGVAAVRAVRVPVLARDVAHAPRGAVFAGVIARVLATAAWVRSKVCD